VLLFSFEVQWVRVFGEERWPQKTEDLKDDTSWKKFTLLETDTNGIYGQGGELTQGPLGGDVVSDVYSTININSVQVSLPAVNSPSPPINGISASF